MDQSTVIIGAGQAGIQAASSLRSKGYTGRIIIISDEDSQPYQKPPLSKNFLVGEKPYKNLYFRPEEFYTKKDIELILGRKVQSIDTENQTVLLNDGNAIDFNHLIIATGSRNRELNLPGSKLNGIHYLRTVKEAEALRVSLESAKSIAVIGGGFIGLEIAAAANKLGKSVTVIEMMDKLMARVLPSVISKEFEQKHKDMGVEIRFNSSAIEFTGGDSVNGVLLNDGQKIEADIIVVGIGVIPNEELAANAGIQCSNGVLVDEHCRSNCANIYAIGDCAAHFNPFVKKVIRLESVQNAMDQAKTAAAAICNEPQKYNYVPWFWTHQYDFNLQMAGCNFGFDDFVIRGDQEVQKFSVYYYKNDQLIGVDSLNKPADHLAARKLIQAGISPTRSQAKDTEFNLKELLNLTRNS